jgi:hypothetical protein
MKNARAVWLFAALLLCPSLARAEEPRGCDKFKWPVAHEQAALQDAQKPRVESGGALTIDAAAALRLVPLADAHFVLAPERAPKSTADNAGMASAPAPAAGVYKISLSEAGWIDVVQDGAFVKSLDFSGALDCPGIRKIVKFSLAAKPFTIEVSGVHAPELSLIVSPE